MITPFKRPVPSRLPEEILQSLPLLVISFDEEGRITFCNRAWGDWLGENIGVKGECWWKALELGVASDELVQQWRANRGRGKIITGKVHLRCSPPHQNRWLLARIAEAGTSSSRREWVACFTDIHGLGISDNPLERRTNLFQSFAAEMATSAFSMLGWVRIFRIGRSLDPETEWTLRALEKSAQAQSSVVAEVRELSHLLQKKQELSRFRENLVDLVRSVADDLEKEVRANGLRLECEFAGAEVPARVNIGKFRQALTHFVRSAIRHCAGRGQITLRVSLRERGPVVEVLDTGLGISPVKLAQLRGHEPEGQKTGKVSAEAVGLHFALAIHFMELQGGHIEVHSEGENRGTCVALCFPATEPLGHA